MKWIFMVLISTLLCNSASLLAQQDHPDKSEVTITWDEFKKLLNLDENQLVIPLETFHKMLEQTGLKPLSSYTVSNGNVILSRDEFQKLVNQMKPPADPEQAPPFEFLITKALYRGQMSKSATEFEASFSVQVLKKEGYLKIPVLPQSNAIQDLRVNGKPALIVTEAGYHQVILSGRGEYIIQVSFSIATTLDKGPHQLDLAIQQTSITLLELELPLNDISVEIPQAQQLTTKVKGNSTLIGAILSPGRLISIHWGKKIPVTEKGTAKLYSEINHLVSIEDDALKINSDIQCNILHNEINGLRISIPANLNILSVSGEGVGEWQDILQAGQRLLIIPFTYSKKGTMTINLISEVPFSESGCIHVFTGFRVLDCVRESGFIGLELNTSAEVIPTENEGLEKIPVQKLPQALINKSVKPLLFGFKYLKHPNRVTLEVRKHEKIAVPMATIHSANAVTLFTEDGKMVHRVIYQIRNSAKQFLEVSLPEGSVTWSVFVGNQAVESSLNGQGKLLVPLIRSRSVNDQLDSFPVEIIYAQSAARFSWLGAKGTSLPAVDLISSQLIWSVYLPYDYNYNYFSSSLEKEEMIRGINFISDNKRNYNAQVLNSISEELESAGDEMSYESLKRAYSDNEPKSWFKNIPMEEEQIAGQMKAELNFGNRLEKMQQNVNPSVTIASGILPIQIKIPIHGQLYRFARTIINPDDPLKFDVYYSQSWINRALFWFLIMALGLVLILNRRYFIAVLNRLQQSWSLGVQLYKQYENNIKQAAQSKMTPVILFGLLIITWTSSFFTVSLMIIFLLFLSSVYQILNYTKNKRSEKIQAQAVVVEQRAKRSKNSSIKD